jgi:hypothetical protein
MMSLDDNNPKGATKMEWLTRREVFALTPEEREEYAEWAKQKFEETKAIIAEANGDPDKLKEGLSE